MTSKWYKAVLEKLNKNDKVVDIGIGTATSLFRNIDLVNEKRLSFVGIDYDSAYISTADKTIKNKGFQDIISVHCASVFDKGLRKIVHKGGNGKDFDIAYFSGSWTLMPEPVKALRVAANLIK